MIHAVARTSSQPHGKLLVSVFLIHCPVLPYRIHSWQRFRAVSEAPGFHLTPSEGLQSLGVDFPELNGPSSIALGSRSPLPVLFLHCPPCPWDPAILAAPQVLGFSHIEVLADHDSSAWNSLFRFFTCLSPSRPLSLGSNVAFPGTLRSLQSGSGRPGPIPMAPRAFPLVAGTPCSAAPQGLWSASYTVGSQKHLDA